MKMTLLGAKPFVLIQLNSASEEGEDLELGVSLEWGGGLDQEGAMALLREVAAQSEPPLPTDE